MEREIIEFKPNEAVTLKKKKRRKSRHALVAEIKKLRRANVRIALGAMVLIVALSIVCICARNTMNEAEASLEAAQEYIEELQEKVSHTQYTTIPLETGAEAVIDCDYSF